MDYLPESTRLLYTELLSQCLHGAAPSGRGLSFVNKTIKDARHWYLQLTVGSQKTQHYLGPDSTELQRLIKKEQTLWKTAAPDRRVREQLVAMLVAGGAQTVGAAEARLFELLERVGVFLVGGVLVGSHAFAVYGNMLGVSWPSEATRTHDIDIASGNHITVGLRNKPVDLRQALLTAEMGFVEVPALDRKSPSTSFRIQGKQLSVDILTPLIGKPQSKPILISTFNTYAEPLRFLDYLLEDIQPAVIVARAGILVNVPAPARYALHKLMTAIRRPAALQTKNLKDSAQSERLLRVLLDDRPGDVQLACLAAKQMPEKFITQLRSGIKKLPAALGNRISEYME
jgi:hypothetical protein